MIKMINGDILGGLKASLERGESLKRGMITLYNAGYEKEDIEKCARKLIEAKRESLLHPVAPFPIDLRKDIPTPPPVQPPEVIKPYVPKPFVKPIQAIKPLVTKPPVQPIQRVEPPVKQQVILQKPAPQIQKTSVHALPAASYPAYVPIQRVSDYGGGITPREKTIITVLVSLLIFLLVDLGLIFLFKKEIINFFGKFFG
jgi:hypothetical protein